MSSFPSSQSSPLSGRRMTAPGFSPQASRSCSACWRPVRYNSAPLHLWLGGFSCLSIVSWKCRWRVWGRAAKQKKQKCFLHQNDHFWPVLKNSDGTFFFFLTVKQRWDTDLREWLTLCAQYNKHLLDLRGGGRSVGFCSRASKQKGHKDTAAGGEEVWFPTTPTLRSGAKSQSFWDIYTCTGDYSENLGLTPFITLKNRTIIWGLRLDPLTKNYNKL